MRRGSEAQKSQNTIRRKLRKPKKFKIGHKEKRGLTICCTGEIRAEEENAVYYLKGIRKLHYHPSKFIDKAAWEGLRQNGRLV